MPKHYLGGLFPILYAMVIKRNELVSGYSMMSCVLWSSIFILIYSALGRRKWFRRGIGSDGMILIIFFCMVQLLVPLDIPQQHTIICNWFKPVGKVLQYKLSSGLRVKHILLYLWIAGMGIQTVRFAAARIKMRRLIEGLPKREIAIPDEVSHMLPKRTVVYRCIGIAVPVSIGIRRRMILLPDRDFGEKELCNIIRHETVHLGRYDHVTMLIANLLCVCYWWNPCVYLLRRNLEINLEMRCDAEAVRGMTGDEAAEYMTTLLTVFKNRYRGTYAGLGMLGSERGMRAELRERFGVLEAELTGKGHRSKLGSTVLIAGLMACMLLSYRYVLSPFYWPAEYTGGKLETDGNLVEEWPKEEEKSMEKIVVVDDTSYIVDCGDGSYIVYSQFGPQVATEAYVKALVETMDIKIVTPGE